MLMLTTALAAPVVDVVGDLGVQAWQRAGDHALLLSPGTAVRISGPTMGTTLSVDIGRLRENNAVLTSRVLPIHLAGTLDGLWMRRRTMFRFGVGFGVTVTHAVLKDDTSRFGGWTAGPAFRVRAGTEMPISARVAVTTDAGASIRDQGVDADLRVGLSFRLKGGDR